MRKMILKEIRKTCPFSTGQEMKNEIISGVRKLFKMLTCVPGLNYLSVGC